MQLRTERIKSDEYDFSIQQPKHMLVSQEKDWDYLMGQTYTILGLKVLLQWV